jgi:PTS system nitrogen regulatory IIA component
MQVADILTLDRTACDVAVTSKKRALEVLSLLISGGADSLSPNDVLDCLRAREKLGSTGLGHGVAIPHGRTRHCERAIGAFLRVREGVDYDAADREPVDLMFALLVPERSTDEHLQILARLAELFSDADLRQRLRGCDDCAAIYDLLTADAAPP